MRQFLAHKWFALSLTTGALFLLVILVPFAIFLSIRVPKGPVREAVDVDTSGVSIVGVFGLSFEPVQGFKSEDCITLPADPRIPVTRQMDAITIPKELLPLTFEETLVANIDAQTGILDLKDPNFVTDDSIFLLCTSGRVCKVIGHRWKVLDWGVRGAGYERECHLCLKKQKRTYTPGEWAEWQ